MSIIERAGVVVLHKVEPELSHKLSIMALKWRMAPVTGLYSSPVLRTRVAGMDLPNPIGMAAGFDKNAVALPSLVKSGFGWLEVGAATPRAQPGREKPRLFRLSKERAIINRFGFNNDGMEPIAARLARRPQSPVRVGLNLGANKDSDDRTEDFCKVLKCSAPGIDFATINVSSPNTKDLRKLQGADALPDVLKRVLETRDALETKIPVMLKIAPDLSPEELEQVAASAVESGIDAIIATNTTLSRKGISHDPSNGDGGLSGEPLFEMSTRVLARLSQLTEGRVELIGVGGIATGEQAYQKIRAGAGAVQVYTAMVYEGLSISTKIARELEKCLKRDGFSNVSEAVGTGRDAWL